MDGRKDRKITCLQTDVYVLLFQKTVRKELSHKRKRKDYVRNNPKRKMNWIWILHEMKVSDDKYNGRNGRQNSSVSHLKEIHYKNMQRVCNITLERRYIIKTCTED